MICIFMNSFLVPVLATTDIDSGYSTKLPHLYGVAVGYNLHHTGPEVKCYQYIYLWNNTDDRKLDVSYDWRFRLQITGIDPTRRDKAQLTPVIREVLPTPEGIGTLDEGETLYKDRNMNLSANGLEEGRSYGMIAYTRLTVSGKVKEGRRYVTRSDEWFANPWAIFTAQ